ncbi:unannotated protein [freshwater metagenome]|uniref:Unannotated protein n=1 Tax=freshwater metagenome TaxID=449393 RepID=A0A6J7J411_9ZZZZ
MTPPASTSSTAAARPSVGTSVRVLSGESVTRSRRPATKAPASSRATIATPQGDTQGHPSASARMVPAAKVDVMRSAIWAGPGAWIQEVTPAKPGVVRPRSSQRASGSAATNVSTVRSRASSHRRRSTTSTPTQPSASTRPNRWVSDATTAHAPHAIHGRVRRGADSGARAHTRVVAVRPVAARNSNEYERASCEYTIANPLAATVATARQRASALSRDPRSEIQATGTARAPSRALMSRVHVRVVPSPGPHPTHWLSRLA